MFKKRFSIDSEIYIIFIIVVNITVFNGLFGFINMHKNHELSEKVLLDNIPSVESLEKINLLVNRSRMLTTNWIYMQSNEDDKKALHEHQDEKYPDMKGSMKALMTLWDDTLNVRRMNNIFFEFDELIQSEKQIMNTLTVFDDYQDPMKKFSAAEILETDVQGHYNLISSMLKQVNSDKRKQATVLAEQLQSSYQRMMYTLSIMALIIIATVLFVVYYMTCNMIRPIHKLKGFILQMSRGEIPDVELKSRKNAVGQMTEAVKVLAQGMSQTAKFASEIGKENFNTEFQPLSENDEFGNALVQMRESLRKAAEEKNKHLSEVEKINKQLDEFVYIVSHDLKAPLRGISTLTSFIEEELASQPNEKINEFLHLLKSRTGRMQNLIIAILEYSKLSTTKSPKENVKVSELLDNIVDMISPPDHFSIIKAGEFPTLFTERIKLQQVLQNLISNGIKYNDKPAGVIEISSRENGMYYHFCVKDNGKGIKKE
ncbi:MAG: MCP four helix bundle domain-containing protein, partial [Bacteroidia bacterium]|nr:MCP four helix bundle domain-containing protein [Bacteroidia bacterium]